MPLAAQGTASGRGGLKGKRRQPIQEAASFIQVGWCNLLALGEGCHLPARLPASQSPTQETLPFSSSTLGTQKNTSHKQGLDQAIVELADVAVQVTGLCESALTPAAGVGLLPRVDHGVPA